MDLWPRLSVLRRATVVTHMHARIKVKGQLIQKIERETHQLKDGHDGSHTTFSDNALRKTTRLLSISLPADSGYVSATKSSHFSAVAGFRGTSATSANAFSGREADITSRTDGFVDASLMRSVPRVVASKGCADDADPACDPPRRRIVLRRREERCGCHQFQVHKGGRAQCRLYLHWGPGHPQPNGAPR